MTNFIKIYIADPFIDNENIFTFNIIDSKYDLRDCDGFYTDDHFIIINNKKNFSDLKLSNQTYTIEIETSQFVVTSIDIRNEKNLDAIFKECCKKTNPANNTNIKNLHNFIYYDCDASCKTYFIKTECGDGNIFFKLLLDENEHINGFAFNNDNFANNFYSIDQDFDSDYEINNKKKIIIKSKNIDGQCLICLENKKINCIGFMDCNCNNKICSDCFLDFNEKSEINFKCFICRKK